MGLGASLEDRIQVFFIMWVSGNSIEMRLTNVHRCYTFVFINRFYTR